MKITPQFQLAYSIIFNSRIPWISGIEHDWESRAPGSPRMNALLSTKWHQTCSLFLLVQIQIQNSPFYFNSSITGHQVNSPRLWFDVIFDFNALQMFNITLHDKTNLWKSFHITFDYFRMGTFELLNDIETLIQLSEDIRHGAREQGVFRGFLKLKPTNCER